MEKQSQNAVSHLKTMNQVLFWFLAKHEQKVVDAVRAIKLEWEPISSAEPVRLNLKVFGDNADEPLLEAKNVTADSKEEGEGENSRGFYLDEAVLEFHLIHAFLPRRSVCVSALINDQARKAVIRITDAAHPNEWLPMADLRRAVTAP